MFSGAIRLLLAIIFSPRQTWKELSKAKDGDRFFKRSYLFPIVILIALTSLVGGYLHADEHLLQNAVKDMLVALIEVSASLFISSYLFNEYLGSVSAELKNMSRSRQFMAYASALNYVLYMLVALFSDLFFLWMFSIYAAYLVYMGSFQFLKLSEDKRGQFVAITSLLVLFVPFIVKNILGHIVIKS
ncbi:MAG: hypothetical protein BGN96_13825 [Bacteroidales bacterium 45-6]|nr:MAG: hypothetical protein BGN96_13825 [Bacteroidales bacterium 45-6]